MNEELYEQLRQQYPDLPEAVLRAEANQMAYQQGQESKAVDPTAPIEGVRFGAGFDQGVRQLTSIPEGVGLQKSLQDMYSIREFEKTLEGYNDNDEVPFFAAGQTVPQDERNVTGGSGVGGRGIIASMQKPELRTKAEWMEEIPKRKQTIAQTGGALMADLKKALDTPPEDMDIPKSLAEAFESGENFSKYATYNVGQIAPTLALAIAPVVGSTLLENSMSFYDLVESAKGQYEVSTGEEISYEDVIMNLEANPEVVARGGLVAGSLDLISLGLIAKSTGADKLAKRLLTRGVTDMTKEGGEGLLKRIGKGAVGGLGAELPTETLQAVATDISRQVGTGTDIKDVEVDWAAAFEEGAAAGTGALFLGAGGRGAFGPRKGRGAAAVAQAEEVANEANEVIKGNLDELVSPEVQAVMDTEESKVQEVVADYATRVKNILDAELQETVTKDTEAQEAAGKKRTAEEERAVKKAKEAITREEERDMTVPERDTVSEMFDMFRGNQRAKELSAQEGAQSITQGKLATQREKEESVAVSKAKTRDESKRAIADTKREQEQDSANRKAEEARLKENERATKIAQEQDKMKADEKAQDTAIKEAGEKRKAQEEQAVTQAEKRKLINDARQKAKEEAEAKRKASKDAGKSGISDNKVSKDTSKNTKEESVDKKVGGKANQKKNNVTTKPQKDVSEKTTKQDQGKVGREESPTGRKSKDDSKSGRVQREDSDKSKKVGRPKLPANETKAYQTAEEKKFEELSPSVKRKVANDPDYAKHKHRKKAIAFEKKAKQEKVRQEQRAKKERVQKEANFSKARNKAVTEVQKALNKVGVDNFERSAFNKKTQFKERVYTDKTVEQRADKAISSAMEAAKALDPKWDFTKAAELKGQILKAAKDNILEKSDPEAFKKLKQREKAESSQEKAKERAAKVLTKEIEDAHDTKGTSFVNLAEVGRNGTISTRKGTAVVRRGASKFYRTTAGTWFDSRGDKIEDPTLEDDYKVAMEKTPVVVEDAQAIINGRVETTEDDFRIKGNLHPVSITGFMGDIAKNFKKLTNALNIGKSEVAQLEYFNELLQDYVGSLSQNLNKYLEDNNITEGLQVYVVEDIIADDPSRIINGFVKVQPDGSPIVVLKAPSDSLITEEKGKTRLTFPTAAGTVRISKENAIRSALNHNHIAIHELIHALDSTMRLAMGDDLTMYEKFDDTMKAHYGKAMGSISKLRNDIREGRPFNKRLFYAVRDYLEFLYPDQKNIMEDWLVGTADNDVLLGVRNQAEFFAELANPFFASILKSIRYTKDATLSNKNNVLYRTLQTMTSFLGKIFKNVDYFNQIDNTLLAGVLNNVDDFYKQTVFDGKVIRQVKGAGGDTMFHQKKKGGPEQKLSDMTNKIERLKKTNKIHPKTVGLANTIQKALTSKRDQLDPVKANQIEREALREFEKNPSSDNAMDLFFAKLNGFLLQTPTTQDALMKEIGKIVEDGVNLRKAEVAETNKIKNKLSKQAIDAISNGKFTILLPDGKYNKGDVVLRNGIKFEITKGKNVSSELVSKAISKKLTDEEKDLISVLNKKQLTPKDLNVSKFKRAMDNSVLFYVNGIRTMDSLMENMAEPGEKIYDGPLAVFANILRQAGDDYAAGLKAKQDEYSEIRKKLFKKMKVRDFRNMMDTETTIDFITTDNDGVVSDKQKKKVTYGQLVDLYNQLQDESLVERYEINNYDLDTMRDQVEGKLPDELIQYAKDLRKFYADYYDSINEVYQKVTGGNLEKIKNYTPIHQDPKSKDSFVNILKSTFDYTTNKFQDVFNDHVKDRGGITEPILEDADTKALRYMTLMERFKAFAIPQDAVANVFGEGSEIRNVIDKKLGTGYMQIIDTLVNSQITGRLLGTNAFTRGINWLRSNSVIIALAGNLSLLPKQFASFVSFMASMPSHIWAQRTLNPVEWYRGYKLLRNSPYMEKRWNQGFEREYREFMQKMDEFGEVANSETKVRQFRNKLIEYLMMPVKIGDIGAIYLGGAAQYSYLYDMYKDQGMSDEEALKKADFEFGKTADLSQQSTQNMDLSYFQTIPLGRLFTMYQSSPILYFNQMMDGLRRTIKARDASGKAKGILHPQRRTAFFRFLMFQFILPSAFYAVSSAGELPRDEDGEVDMSGVIIPIMIGALTGMPILSAALNYIMNKSRGKNFPFRISPAERDLERVARLTEELAGDKSPILNEDGELFGEEALTAEELDYWTKDPDAIRLTTDVISYMTRLPINQIAKKKNAYRQWDEGYIKDRSKFLRLYLGYSPYAVPSMEKEMQDYREERKKLRK